MLFLCIFLANLVEFMIFKFFYIIIFLGDNYMNNFEVIRLLNIMVDNTRKISIESRIHYINQALAIDKKGH